MENQFRHLDTSELTLPETLFIHDIDSRVFQAIALQCIVSTEGLASLAANLLDSFLGRDSTERAKGIHVEQSEKEHSVNFRIEVNIAYGIAIGPKAKELQEKVSVEVSRLTGLHVACVHVIFKNIFHQKTDPAIAEAPRPERGSEQEVEPSLIEG